MEHEDFNGAFRHTQERVEQRYGLYFTEYDYRKLRNALVSGRSRVLAQLSRGREECLVFYRNREFRVIYSFDADLITTALPPLLDVE